MIEKTVLDYLNTAGNLPSGVEAYMEVPEDTPERFITIEKTGGGIRDHICTATLAVQAYGSSLYEAAALNETVKALLSALADVSDDVGSCTLNSDYNFTDTSTKRYRYQSVWNIVHY